MKTEILYVELIQGHSGPAWIGYGQFNKTRRTVYFDGKILGRGQGIIGNFVDIELGDEYWVSGVKKNGEDRHWAGTGKIFIDKSVINDYLKIIGEKTLPKNKFIQIEINNTPNKLLSREIENKKYSENSFNKDLLEIENPKELSSDEIKKILVFYSKIDLSNYSIKLQKKHFEKVDVLNYELELRSSREKV
jgi:hypothetical protein